MAQITLNIDDETAKQLDEVAAKEGLSSSAWAEAFLTRQLKRRFPKEWYDLWGSWEDDRTPEEILRDIRSGPAQRETEPFE